MAEKLFKVCARCERPAKMLDPVEILAVNKGLLDAGTTGEDARGVEWKELMCRPCWKRVKRFIARGIQPTNKKAVTG